MPKTRPFEQITQKHCRYWSIQEAIEYYGVSRTTLYTWDKDAKAAGKGFIVGRAGYKVDRTALERWFLGDK
jgi:hypothetical protein